ncbi:MAG: tol-pal system protein YbgF [Xanthomonadales bacterium]|nr:tol-pal system protein YbgF [Gammaproteobacteria bacterium]MBT8053688.1 tol-pal system protein YbgF [Gammaproteobacteria bacterium]NND57057.1 tol-pal system protein YbgF [Xanthomonadales bacterium]NNK51861.1 tol-pal system protein YbgF [Xanthomonadales bacterium]
MMYRKCFKTLVASFALATIVSAPVSGPLLAQDAGSSAMANLVIQVQELQDEVRMLRGQLEEQSRELENLKRRQRDQYLDLDQRLSEMRDAQPVAGAGPAVRAAQGPTVSPAQDSPEVRDPMESQSQVSGIGQPVAQSQSAPGAGLDEKAAYDQAFQALKELRYADAAEEFQSFLDRYPNSEYADNAQYWLGESYYVTRNYDIALASFESLIAQFPESPKAPDALLKIGYTHYELEQWDSARAALTQVQENYPDTTLSRLAENRLRSMRMEGHY